MLSAEQELHCEKQSNQPGPQFIIFDEKSYLFPKFPTNFSLLKIALQINKALTPLQIEKLANFSHRNTIKLKKINKSKHLNCSQHIYSLYYESIPYSIVQKMNIISPNQFHKTLIELCHYFLHKNVYVLIEKKYIGVNLDNQIKVHIPAKQILIKNQTTSQQMIHHMKNLCIWYEEVYTSSRNQYLNVPEKKKNIKKKITQNQKQPAYQNQRFLKINKKIKKIEQKLFEKKNDDTLYQIRVYNEKKNQQSVSINQGIIKTEETKQKPTQQYRQTVRSPKGGNLFLRSNQFSQTMKENRQAFERQAPFLTEKKQKSPASNAVDINERFENALSKTKNMIGMLKKKQRFSLHE